MPVDEVPEKLRDGSSLHVATGLDFRCDFVRHVVRPMLKGVECDHPDRVVKLAGQEIGDDRFEIRPLDLGLAVYTAAGKAVDHKIRGLVRPVRYDPRRPVGLTHYANSHRNRNRPGLKLSLAEWFHAVERLDQYLEAEAQAGL